jgi:hypothetical protein
MDSMPIFTIQYSLESAWRDLQNPESSGGSDFKNFHVEHSKISTAQTACFCFFIFLFLEVLPFFCEQRTKISHRKRGSFSRILTGSLSRKQRFSAAKNWIFASEEGTQ